MLKYFLFLLLGLSIFLCGCAPASPAIKNGSRSGNRKKTESATDVKRALGSVTGALAGQEVTDKDLENLSRDLRKDKEAQSAVNAMTNAVSGMQSDIKYCPVDGQRFSGKIKICPVHKMELKSVKD